MGTLDKLHGDITRIIFNDDYEVNLGFTGSMISAWEKLKKDSNDWIFHLEEDFLIQEDVNLNDMIEVMINHPYLSQMVLLRQPLRGRELQKGGIIASHPERYEDKTNGTHFWVEHRISFSCNPSLYRKSLINTHPWPNTTQSERVYGKKLKQDPDLRFAYWGKKVDIPKVEHIGEIKTGFGY